jgi:hypothetical protein
MLRLIALGVIVLASAAFWATASAAHDRRRWDVGLVAVAAFCSTAVTGGVLILAVTLFFDPAD